MESTLRRSAPAGLTLFETMGVDPEHGIRFLDLHLDRMCVSARKLGIPFDRPALIALLSEQSTFAPARLRLSLSLAGTPEIICAPLPPTAKTWRIALAQQRVQSDDPWRGHKTSQRKIYDDARAALPDGIDELVFLNELDHLTEGTITNLFLDHGDGILHTPPLSAGVLPGVLRRHLLQSGRAKVAPLNLADLETESSQIFAGNALRGLIPCVYVAR